MRTIPDSSRSRQRLLANVRNIPSDLFLAELRIAGDALELLDVNRGEEIVLHQRSEMRIESSKLYPPHGMNATTTFRPSASSPVLGRRTVGDELT